MTIFMTLLTVIIIYLVVVAVSVSTTKSLLECKRFYSKADAQEIADKHGFVVRKIIVKVEE